MPKAAKATTKKVPSGAPDPLGRHDANIRRERRVPGSAGSKEKASTTTSQPGTEPAMSEQPATAKETASNASSADNYLIMISLSHTMDPCMERLLSVPPSTTFSRMHNILQVAFGWSQSHAHSFQVSELPDREREREQLMGPPQLLTISPDPDMFEGMDMGPMEHEDNMTLADVYEKPEWKGKVGIMYEYDHGDGWEHQFALIGRAPPGSNAQVGAPADIKVLCVAGTGHPAAEDSGGFSGWEDLKDLFEHPRKRDEDDRKGWYKTICLNGNHKGLKPYEFSVLDVNDDLQEAGLCS